MLDHGVEHLGSNDDRFLGKYAFLDEDALNSWDALLWNLYSEVTTSHHYTVGNGEDVVDVVNAFLILNLCYDLNVRAVFVKNFADVENVLLGADE